MPVTGYACVYVCIYWTCRAFVHSSLCSDTHKDKTPRLTNASRPKPAASAASAVSAPRTVPENNVSVSERTRECCTACMGRL